jgi:hypothetical protein
MPPNTEAVEYENWIVANANKRGTPEFNTVVLAYEEALAEEQALSAAPVVTPAPTEDIGFIEGIGEAFTGGRRRTPETEAAESYQFMPEFNSMDTLWPTAKVAVGTMMGTPDEMTQVITTQFPDITARKDEKGNNFLTSPTDGQEYVIKPGMELSDIPRGLSSAALFALLKGRGVLRASGEAMVVQAGYEGAQTRLGGDFNTLDVVMAGGIPLAFAVLAAPIKLAYRNTIGRLMNRNTPPSTVTTATLLSDEELVDVARRAAANDAEAIQLLAEMSAPDEKVLEAARRLGIDEFLQPDHYTTDQGFRELAQIAKSVKPSKVGAAETEGLIKVGQRAFDLIEELGGDIDLSRMNQQVRVKDIALATGQRDLYDVAKATTRQIVGFEDDITSLFGQQAADSMVPMLGNSIGALTKGDADTFVRLINNVPEELRESVVASGLQGAFGRATLNGALNFNSYARWYDGLLRNRVAMNTMFKYLPNGARKQLSDLYRVAKAVNLSTVQAVRTGRPIQGALEGDTLLGKFYTVGKRAAIAVPLELAATPLGLGGSGIAAGVAAAVAGGRGLKSSTIKALDEVMTSPQFINAAANAGTAQEQATIRALAASRPFINFLKSVNIPPSEGEQFIRSAFQSVRAGASDVSPTAPVVEEDVVIPPQASVSREMLRKTLAPSTRGGISGLGEPANEVAAAPAMAPPPSAVAQGQGPSESSQMMARLFPFDMA